MLSGVICDYSTDIDRKTRLDNAGGNKIKKLFLLYMSYHQLGHSCCGNRTFYYNSQVFLIFYEC